MNLIRDCLDKQVNDRFKRRMGRVDGIVIEVESGGPPRVAYVELGVKTLMNRLSRRLGKMITHEPYRIPWGKIKVGLNEVRADVEAEKTPALEWELWLRKKVIGRIPGA